MPEAINTTMSLWYQPAILGWLVQLLLIVLIALSFRTMPQWSFTLLFKWAVEKIHDFLQEILGTHEKKWILSFLTSIFFVVLIANLLGLVGDIVWSFVSISDSYAQSIGLAQGENMFGAFSWDKNATTALSLIIVLLSLVIQLFHIGPIKFFSEYFPIMGKWYLSVDRGQKSAIVYYPMLVVVKLFDIIISLFIGVLDIIGIFAKIISVSFRLFGNMFSGTILLGILTTATIWLSQSIGGLDFPFLFPIILWIQSLLVALVQAFVVTLLGAIFIKVAKA